MISNYFEKPGKIGEATVYNVTPVRGGDAFLFVYDDVTFLFDSGFGFSSSKLYENIVEVLGERPLDYVLLTHSHYDHALGSAHLSKMYPNLKVVALSYAAKIFGKEGARATMMRLDEAAREINEFDTHFEDIDNLHADIAVEDGEIIKVGNHDVQIVSLPGHTRDSIGYYFINEKLMLGCETIGMYAKDDIVMPSFLVGYQMSLDSIDKVSTFDIDYYMIPHWGMLTKEQAKKFFEDSKKSHVLGKDIIVGAYKAGKTKDEIIEIFAEGYYSDEVKKMYPPAAFAENINIQIPLILHEMGLV